LSIIDRSSIEAARLSAQRLAAVERTGLLDAPPTAALDRLTRLAASLIDVPATFISLVDAKRDFYVSQCGFPEPLASGRELGGETFCHHAMVHDGVLAIENTRAYPVYREVSTVIFAPFWQADPSRHQGAGLGLHIVRGIVEAHGGTVRASSRLGHGTTFEIDLPLAPAPR